MDSVDALLDFMEKEQKSFIFANLVEFDMVFGHRRNAQGYADALEDFDQRLPEIIDSMNDNDLLVITADHGCDPTYKGTDHTREYVPLLLYGEKVKKDFNLNTRESFADLAQTTAEIFDLEKLEFGKSFLKEILKEE
jgi:phosphopentomutase